MQEDHVAIAVLFSNGRTVGISVTLSLLLLFATTTHAALASATVSQISDPIPVYHRLFFSIRCTPLHHHETTGTNDVLALMLDELHREAVLALVFSPMTARFVVSHWRP